MPSAVRGLSVLRFSARLLVLGLWTVVFGLLVLSIFAQLFGSLATAPSVTSFGQQTGFGLDRMLFDALMLLYHGGFLTVGIGGVMTVFGGALLVRVAQ